MNTPTARLTGIDLARGLAILGMIIAHVGASDIGPISRFFWLADGRPSALFAVLAGWGLHFMTSQVFGDGARLRHERNRIARRALALAALGLVIETFFPTPVAVILVPYAGMFILALPFLGRSVRFNAISAAIILIVMPFFVFTTRYALDGIYYVGGSYVPFLHSLVTGYYPAITWLAYLLAGLCAGRLLHGRSLRAGGPWLLLITGLALCALGYGGALMLQTLTGNVMIPGLYAGSMTEAYLSIEPHSGSPFELMGNIGCAFLVIALCLVICRIHLGNIATFPIRAMGEVSLSAYVLHILIIFVLTRFLPIMEIIEPATHLILAIVALPVLVGATAWVRFLGQGPLERALSRIAGKRAI